jgi:ABC-2 type transport system permease protein
MMLAYKAWRETRARFLLSAAALAWFCSALVVFRPAIQYARGRPFADFVVDGIYAGAIRNLFVIVVVACGMGGLVQEAAQGTAAFTLALPVTRRQLVAARGIVGACEVAALALVPTACVLGWSSWTHERFGAIDALRYSAQWAATGTALFGVAFVLSAWIAAAYAALAAAALVLTTYVSVLNLPALRALPALNVFALMNRDHPSSMRIGGAVLAAVAMIAAAAWTTERRDF